MIDRYDLQCSYDEVCQDEDPKGEYMLSEDVQSLGVKVREQLELGIKDGDYWALFGSMKKALELIKEVAPDGNG